MTPHWNDGLTRWNEGGRWLPAVPQLKHHKTMANIALKTNKLPITGKIVKGQQIITMSTGNPLVPGNAAALTAFGNTQADLIAANDAYETSRQVTANLLSQRDDAEAAWNTTLNGLAGVTENATQGVKTAILSAGFDVRGTRTPTPPLQAPAGMNVATNGSPGVSKLKWNPVHGAVSYLVEQSPDPITDQGWVQVDTPTKASCEIGGAEPGKILWFRAAAVNASGAGPWSEPAKRPVM